MVKNVLITGGAGYVGTRLTPQLLAAGHRVLIYDTLWYGNELKEHPGLKIVQGDIRDRATFEAACWGVDAVIHLACISNDPSFELDPSLSKTINFDCFEGLVTAAKGRGVKRFIYASTSSVYGVSDEPEVTEDHPLIPLTDYNKYKGLCEPLLFKHQSPDFVCVTIRPATVCGYSPRMRFDLSVNILTNHAVKNGKITVFGGMQKRPNIHIQDMCELYMSLLTLPDEKIAGETFNAGYENQRIADLAEIVKTVVEEEFPGRPPIEIVTTPTNDIRSYHINSNKIREKLGFAPRHSIADAVREICAALKRGEFPEPVDAEKWINVRVLKGMRAA